MTTSNPFGLHSVTPYLVVDNVRELIQFLGVVFGASVRDGLRLDSDGTRIRHAEIQVGDSVIMMGEATEDFPVARTTLYTYVDDCDATYAKALDEGATSLFEPRDFPHGDRYGGIEDPAGNIWWIATHVGKQDDAENPGTENATAE